MVEWRCGNLKKCHQIAVALRVADGGAMAAAIAMAELRFFFVFCEIGVGLTRPNPNPIFACKRGEQRKQEWHHANAMRPANTQHLHHDGEHGTPHQHHAHDDQTAATAL